jgi:hypothetical protein
MSMRKIPVKGKGGRDTPQFPMEKRKTSLLSIIFLGFFCGNLIFLTVMVIVGVSLLSVQSTMSFKR